MIFTHLFFFWAELHPSVITFMPSASFERLNPSGSMSHLKCGYSVVIKYFHFCSHFFTSSNDNTITLCCSTDVSSSGSTNVKNITGRNIESFDWAIMIIKLTIVVCQQPVQYVWRVPYLSDFNRGYAAEIWHIIRSTVQNQRMNKIDGSSFITTSVAFYILIIVFHFIISRFRCGL